MHEIGVGRSVGRFYGHVRLSDCDGIRHLRQHHGDACSQHGAELLSRHPAETLVFQPVLLEMLLITHIELSYDGRRSRILLG
jgi:hypothetical protein